MEKLDLKKKWQQLYAGKPGVIVAVEVPQLAYLMVDGEGDPNTAQSYQEAIEALFSLSYTLKFVFKKGPRAIDYGVMPLEGMWWADDPRDFGGEGLQANKSKWKWTMMIVQPEFIAQAHVDAAMEEVRKKKNPAALNRVRFETLIEGTSAQVLHVGPFSAEGPVIQRMHDFIHAAGKELCGKHHEIYLSDPRRTAPEKLKTILRQPMG
jgi:hypothetical protein